MKYARVLLFSLLCIFTSQIAPAQVPTVTATDDSFEDRVELSWSGDIPLGEYYRIQRDGEVLGIRSRTDQMFVDRTGDPGVTYTYCVTPTGASGNDGAGACDSGRRSILPAGSVAATDRTLEDRVGVTWSDRSEIEAAYRVYRTTVGVADSTLLATLAANRSIYNDATAVTGTTYRYCIVAVDAGGFTAVPACDEGSRGAVLPPAAVAATDGRYDDRVRVTWVDQTTMETGYTVYRDGTQLVALGADVTLFDDMTAAVGVDANYCVSATIGGVESVQVCDSGRRGALAPPQSVVASDNTFDDRVDVTWGDAGETEDGFVVTRYLGAAVDVVFPALGKDVKSFADATAEQQVTYGYCVKAFSDAGAPTRSYSVEVCDDGTRSAVLAPTAVAASDRTYEDRSEITWTSQATTAMLFNIYRDGTLVDNIPGNELVYGDTQIASGMEHAYCVAAMTVTGASLAFQIEVAELVRSMRAETARPFTSVAAVAGAEQPGSAEQPDDAEVEDAVVIRDPEGVLRAVQQSVASAAAGDIVESAWACDMGSRLLNPPTDVEATFESFEDHVEVTWTDNSSVERGHRIYRQGPADPQPVVVGEANTGRVSLGDYGGVPGVTYTYSVRAFDRRGPGGESTADSDTGGRKLEAPTGLTATGGPSEIRVPLAWIDNSRAESGYEVKRDDGVVAQVGENVVAYVDTTPVIGVPHTYEVTAIDVLGRSETATVEAGTVVLPPGSFSASDTYLDRVVLVWEDNSTMATDYVVTRDGFQLAVLDGNATGYADQTVDAGRNYQYCATTVADTGGIVSNSETVCDSGGTSVAITEDQLQSFMSPELGNTYGISVGISGRTAVVGAWRDDPRPGGYVGLADGAAYILEQDPVSLNWDQAAALYSDDKTSTNGDLFGGSVAVSGNTVVVGAQSAGGGGSAWVFVKNPNSGEWERTQRLFGTSSVGRVVALDGNTLFVGMSGSTTPIHVYERDSESDPFVKIQELAIDGSQEPPYRLSLSGDVAAVGAFFRNPVVYRRDNLTGLWGIETTLTRPEGLSIDSYTVSISDRFAFAWGQENPGTVNRVGVVHVYERNTATGSWGTPTATPGQVRPSYVLRPPDAESEGDGSFGQELSISGSLAAINSASGLFLYNLNPISGQWEPVYDSGPGGRPVPRKFKQKPGETEIGWKNDVSEDKVIFSGFVGGTSGNGIVYISTRPTGNLLPPPQSVAATDGAFAARVQVQWNDEAANEDGYRVYRDGKLVAELPANSESFSDFDTAPGLLAEYCVATFRSDLVVAPEACDHGWRPPDGAISGSVRAPQTPAGSSVLANAQGLDGGQQIELSTIGSNLLSAPSILAATAAGAAATDSVLICIAPDPDRSLLFDGSGGSVRFPFGSLGNAFTIEFWAKRSSLDTELHALVSIGGAGSTQQVSARFLATGTLRFTVGGSNLDYAESDPSGWHHWALTKTAAGARQIIRDGVVVQSDAGAASALTGGLLVLGSDADTTSFFSGTMDELRVWNMARTAPQVASLKDRRLAGNEAGLVGYWPMNQGLGRAVGDQTASGLHGIMENGVFWSATGAINSCVLVDTQGKYTLDGIRYNENTTFTVTPHQAERAFDPPASDITLNSQNPVENQVDFIDVTQLGVSGKVLFEGTACVVPDVDIYVDGVSRGSSERDGTYRLSVSPSKEVPYVFRPRKANATDAADVHSFIPTTRNLVVDRALTGVDFTSTKKRTLNAFFGGSCEVAANLGTVTIEVSTENGCFNQTYQVSGEFNIDLPPQKYLVRVTNVQFGEPDLRADMIAYFDELGVQEIDLTNARDTLDLTYHAPVGMTLSGFPSPGGQCSVYTTADGATLPALPVLLQGRPYNVTLNVSEDYGLGRVCPVSNGTVAVYDAIADSANTKRTYDVVDGKVAHRTVVASPNIFKGASIGGVNRSYQKSLTAVAEVPGRDPYVLTEWAIVEGVRTRNSEFVSATTDPFPLLIVHDPPGSNSSAYLEKGKTSCTTMSEMLLGGGAAGGTIDVGIGYNAILGFGVSVENGGGITFKAKTIAGASYKNTRALEICATATEKFSTSGDVGWSGEDVYMGVALNLVFARADELTVDQCVVDVTERLAADLDPENAFETTYVYGETHIRDSLIPDLGELIELSGGDPTLSGDPDGDGTIEVVKLTRALENWKAHLENNKRLKAQALDGSVENISFSAGANYDYSHKVDSTQSTTETVRIYVDTENSIGGMITLFGYNQVFLATVEQHFERTTDNGSSVQTSNGIGYTLSDGDTGDFFSVDIGTDPRYGTPVFGTVSGRSSNPWEANTQRRDWPQLSINPPVQFNVPPDEAAGYTVSLTNASESGERREYVVTPVRPSNRGAAKITVGGTATGGTYLVEPGETQEITVAVERGPSRYSYEDLEIIAYPQPEFAIWQADSRQQFVMSDTARFSLFFDAPCSDISILRPKAPWVLNGAEYGDSLEVILRNFDLSGSDIFDVGRIGFQYRAVGTTDWFPGSSIAVNRAGAAEGDSLDAQARSWIARWLPARDGAYDVRAYTECGVGNRVFSDVAAGIVDTKAPKPLGPPTPADEILVFGSTIAATFNEEVACSTVDFEGTDANASLSYLDGPLAGSAVAGFEAVCDDKTVVITPPDDFDWTPAEGRRMQVSLDALADVYGNPVAAPVKWQFTVRRSAFAWAPANVQVEVSRGSMLKVDARLVNGGAQAADFRVPASLDLLPESGGAALQLAVSDNEGTVVAQGEHKVSFTIPDSLLPGRYTSTLFATRLVNDVAMEQTPLYVTADVVCRAPDWSVTPTNFEQSMTIVARLVVDGVASNDPGDMVVAMVGGEVRGVAPVTEPVPGQYVVQMLVYGNTPGELVQFEVWDADRCMRYRETSKAFLFRSGDKVGSFATPVVLQAPPQSAPQAINLAAGWTWFSTNRIEANPSINSMLAGVTAAPGDIVKSQTQYAQYDAVSGWVGPLTTIANGKGYFAKLQQSNLLVQSATASDPTTPITLNAGWTWVGYLPTAPLATNAALVSLSPAAGDLIKSQYGFAEFVAGTGWVGSLATLQPGLGYLMYVDGGGTLVYPSSEMSSGVLASADATRVTRDAHQSDDVRSADVGDLDTADLNSASVTSVDAASVGLKSVGAKSVGVESASRDVPRNTADQAPPEGLVDTAPVDDALVVDPEDYAETMTIVAEFQRNGVVVIDPNVDVHLYARDELRGVGHFVRVEGRDHALAFIMAYGDASDEQLDVRLYDPATGEVEYLEGGITFSANARLGSVSDAMVLNAVTVEIPAAFELEQNYPNPFRAQTEIRFALPQDSPVEIEVFDVIGRRVAVLLNDQKMPAGWHTVRFDGSELGSGAYWCRITAGEFKSVRKMVLVG